MYNDNYNGQNNMNQSNMGYQPDYNSQPNYNPQQNIGGQTQEYGYDNQMYNQQSNYSQQAGYSGQMNQGYDAQNNFNGQPMYNQQSNMGYQPDYNSQSNYNPQQNVGGQTQVYGYDNQMYNQQPSSSSQQNVGYQPDYNPQPTYNNQPSFTPPQFSPQKKDSSGVKFLIGFIIVVAVIGVGAYMIWPKINAKMNLNGTWNCDNGLNITFNKDNTIEASTNYIGTEIKITGTYESKPGTVKDEYKQYAKDGYSYLLITGKFDKEIYLSQTHDYDEDIDMAFGIKGENAHILGDGSGITCTKK